MQRKPGYLFLLCLTLIFTIGYPSCGGHDYAAIRDISDVDIFDPLTRQFLAAPATTTSDSISLIISMEVKEFSYNFIPGTMNEAWSFFQPSSPMMANEIRDLRIFCDREIYGIAPGQNLAPELLFGIYFSYKWPLSEFLEELPDKGDDCNYYCFDAMHVFFSSKPSPGFYTFTIEVEDNNGHLLTASAPTLEWL